MRQHVLKDYSYYQCLTIFSHNKINSHTCNKHTNTLKLLLTLLWAPGRREGKAMTSKSSGLTVSVIPKLAERQEANKKYNPKPQAPKTISEGFLLSLTWLRSMGSHVVTRDTDLAFSMPHLFSFRHDHKDPTRAVSGFDSKWTSGDLPWIL